MFLFCLIFFQKFKYNLNVRKPIDFFIVLETHFCNVPYAALRENKVIFLLACLLEQKSLIKKVLKLMFLAKKQIQIKFIIFATIQPKFRFIFLQVLQENIQLMMTPAKMFPFQTPPPLSQTLQLASSNNYHYSNYYHLNYNKRATPNHQSHFYY